MKRDQQELRSISTQPQVSSHAISEVVKVLPPDTEEMGGFTAHNILLNNGRWTKPENTATEDVSWFRSAQQVLNLVFPGDKKGVSVVDLGCLEGGYSVGFARMGFDVVGIEVRDRNYERCEYVRRNLDLPNLRFVKDDVMNVDRYAEFDAAFCCGLLYHLDEPLSFLVKLAKRVRKLLIIQTHFAMADNRTTTFQLSELAVHEGVEGRWYGEFAAGTPRDVRQEDRFAWSSLKNDASFWIRREQLIEIIYHLGFQTVFEQFDSLAPNIAERLDLEYHNFLRGTFIGIRNEPALPMK